MQRIERACQRQTMALPEFLACNGGGGAPSVLSNIVACGATHLCDTQLQHVTSPRGDLTSEGGKRREGRKEDKLRQDEEERKGQGREEMYAKLLF